MRTTLEAQPGSEEVRELQVALNRRGGDAIATDGVLGPGARAALARFQRSAGLTVTGEPDPETEHRLLSAQTPRRVLVVRAASGPEPRGSLSARQTREPIEWVYRRHGFEVDLLKGPTLDELVLRLDAPTVPLIHVSAAFVESRGMAMLDLAGEWEHASSAATSGSMRIAPTGLARVLSGSRAIVVLDPPAPRSSFEVALQLMLRNAFAGDVFAHGARAVLGLGLARHAAQERLHEDVVGPLAASRPLGDIVGEVHAAAREAAVRGTEHELAFAGAALFARHGEVRPPWAG